MVDDNGQVVDKEAHGSDIQGHNFIAMFCFVTPRLLWIINTKYIHVFASECKYFLFLQMQLAVAFDLTIMMTMFTRTVFLSVLLFAAHAKKSSPSNSTSNEDEEKANVDNFHFHWYDKLWLYPTIMIMNSFTESIDDVEQVPYKTIKKFDVS